jgi:hypothetical protein
MSVIPQAASPCPAAVFHRYAVAEKNECAVNRVSSGKKGHGSVRAGTVAGRSNNPSTSQDLLKSLRKTEGFVNGILSRGENNKDASPGCTAYPLRQERFNLSRLTGNGKYGVRRG